MTETNFNTYYQDDPEPSMNFGSESLLDGLVEILSLMTKKLWMPYTLTQSLKHP